MNRFGAERAPVAFGFTLGQWDELSVFLDDERVPLDNNARITGEGGPRKSETSRRVPLAIVRTGVQECTTGRAYLHLPARVAAINLGLMSSPPALPLSPVVRVPAGETLVVSGQIAERELLKADAATQATSVLRTLQSILEAEGRTMRDVVRVGIFLVDMADFAAVNEVYREFFAAPFPARTTVAVAALPFGARVEMEALAR